MSPARDHVDGVIDLTALLDLRRPSRYLVRVRGGGLATLDIKDGDILVTDAALKPGPGSVVITIDGDQTRLAVCERHEGRLRLRTARGLLDEEGAEIWAVAVGLIRERL